MAVFRIEKTRNYTVMSNYHLKNKSLSLKSKGLLSMMLSLPEDWNYSTRGLAAICKEGVESIGTALREMEAAGYIIRNKLRDERGRITDTEYIIYENPQTPDMGNLNTALPCPSPPYTGNPYAVKPELETHALLNTNISKTKEINTHESTIHQSIRCDTPDRVDTMERYRELIKENIEYNCLCEQYSRERMDEILELMLETVCSTKKTIRVGGDDFPAEVVKSRFLKINSTHIEYVFETML